MADSRFRAPRLIKIGLVLLVGATVLAFFLLLYDLAGGRIDAILIYALPLSLLMALVGFALTCIGAVGWALRSPVRKLTWIGIALLGFGIVCFLMIDKIHFGFDDPSILFAQLIAFAPFLLGILFLLTAGIRQFRAGIRKTRVTE
jgi:hypothetical protein